jgi:hypothetical protein
MNITKVRAIDWDIALEKLSVGSFFLLNVLYRKNMPMSDKSMMACTGYGLSTHRKQKRELIENNYLAIKQTGKGVYSYLVGEGVTDGEF